MPDADQAYTFIFPILNIVTQLFIWYAFYIFSSILKIIDYEHRIKSGRELLLIALPLLLVQPIIGSYLLFETEIFPPSNLSLLIFVLFFTAYLLIMLTVLHFKNEMKLPIKHKNIIYGYIFAFLVINLYAVKGLSLFELVPHILFLFGKLFLAVSLLIIFEYLSHKFEELRVISGLFFVSAALIFITPITRAYALNHLDIENIETVIRVFNIILMFFVGSLMLIGMMIFRNIMVNFYAVKDGMEKEKKYI